MLFFKKVVTCALALLAVPSLSALTAPQMVANIKALTMKSQNLQVPAKSITIVNGPLIIIGLGPFPQIIVGFADIVSTATTAVGAMQGSATITNPADAKAIADAFRTFVVVHQELLNILIGKAGLFNLVPFIGEPVAAALRSIEGIVDVVAFAIIDLLEVTASKASVESDRMSLQGTIELSIKSYQGIAVGSLAKRHARDFSA